MAEPMSTLSPEKLNASTNHHNETVLNDDDWQNPPSSPFQSHIEHENQENVAPTPLKPAISFDTEFEAPQSAFKLKSPEKKLGLEERSPGKKTPLPDKFAEQGFSSSPASRNIPQKGASPLEQPAMEDERPGSAMSSRSLMSSPSKSFRSASVESTQRLPVSLQDDVPKRLSVPSTPEEKGLRENEGLTVAMQFTEETRSERSTTYHTNNAALNMDDTDMEESEFYPDRPDMSSMDMDDTCFSNFSEMPGIDMTKFASLRQSPTKNGMLDQVGYSVFLHHPHLLMLPQTTPRARGQTTPSTVRRSDRTPSPTPRQSRKDGDTTNLLLDFTAQFEAFSSKRRASPTRVRGSAIKSTTEPNLRSFYDNQRSPAKGGSSHVPATPRQNRPMFNLLDFELPPAPTPRSIPTVTIRELESLKSSFQSQISSLTASLSGKEAQVESLVKAISDAERRVGETQETLRDERSTREHAEAQMEDWKKKGEEVQKLLQDVQSELARNDSEREQLLTRLVEAERRTEESDQRSSDLETRLIEAESKNVDMTTFINSDEDQIENKKIYSEIECQTAIAEKVNEVARDLHTAYKAKHEKKIKALKESYQRKADDRCKELRLQIIRLETQVEDAEKRSDTLSKLPNNRTSSSDDEKCEFCNQVPVSPTTSLPSDLKLLESQKFELESLKAKLAGLESELKSLHKSQDALLLDLEAERVEKGELVAAAEQMLSMCGEKMEEMQQEEFRKSQAAPSAAAAGTGSVLGPRKRRSLSSDHQDIQPRDTQPQGPPQNLRSTGFLAGGGSAPAPASSRPGSSLGGGRPAGHERGGSASGIGKPSGLRAPGGFGASALGRTNSGAGKSRILSNIERMGGGGGGRTGQE
jgi:hypothetical protein